MSDPTTRLNAALEGRERIEVGPCCAGASWIRARRIGLSSRASLVCLVLAACGGSGSDITGPLGPSDPTGPPPTPPADAPALTSGSFMLPAGGKQAFTIYATLPDTLGPTAGLTLVLALRDLTRPEITCVGESPRSGCATVDWDAFPWEPIAPPDGILLNRLLFIADDWSRAFHLRQTLTLADDPEPGPPF